MLAQRHRTALVWSVMAHGMRAPPGHAARCTPVQYWGKTMFRMQVKETPDISVPFDPPAPTPGTPVQLPPSYDPDGHDPGDEEPLDLPGWPVPDDDDGDHDDGRDEPLEPDEEDEGPLSSLCADPHARSL